jgi:hypothetical protein
VPVGVGDAAVDGGRELEGDERPGRIPHLMQEARVLRLRLMREQSELDLEAAGPQPFGATGRHGVGVRHRRHDPPYSGGENRVGARRLLALVSAGLQGAHERCAARPRAGRSQRRSLRMALPVLGVPPLAGVLAAGENDGPHQRVGLHPAPPSPGQLDRARHGVPLRHAVRAGRSARPCAPADLAQRPGGNARLGGGVLRVGHRVGRQDGDQAHAEVEHLAHLVGRDPAAPLQRGEQRRDGPRGRIHDRLAAGGQHPHQVAGDAAAGDVGQRVDSTDHGHDAPSVALVHGQERVGDGAAGLTEPVVEAQAHLVEHDAPGQVYPLVWSPVEA